MGAGARLDLLGFIQGRLELGARLLDLGDDGADLVDLGLEGLGFRFGLGQVRREGRQIPLDGAEQVEVLA